MAFSNGKRLRIISILIAFTSIISACNQQEVRVVSPTTGATATCQPIPQATGEKYILATVEATPPAQLAPGKVLTMTFSGNYLILNNAIVCGEEKEIVGYIYSDELDHWSWEREVIVHMGDRMLESIRCEYTCRIEVTIPEDTPPGSYSVVVNSWVEDITLDLVVTEPN